MPGVPFLAVVIPDEDPGLEATIRIYSHEQHVIPYEIMRWFMDHVAEQVEHCRAVLRRAELGQKGPEAMG
ncbi:hypothetical protein P8605_02315 [Streptomyces sp. T-3]|nr:hypothetical protein [Streptomyces sp. T-3]